MGRKTKAIFPNKRYFRDHLFLAVGIPPNRFTAAPRITGIAVFAVDEKRNETYVAAN